MFIPLHGLVRLSADEFRVIDHPAFQRLGLVYQLGQTHLVFRGATHKRFEHCIGAVHVAQRMIDAISYNHRISSAKPHADANTWEWDTPLSPCEVAFVRLGALLHDIGHLPAGHTLEDEVCLLPAHDKRARLDQVFGRKKWHGLEASETLRSLVDHRFAAFSKEILLADGSTPSATEVVYWLVEKGGADPKLDSQCSFRIQVTRDLIGNTICADLLDYLYRDLHHLGKSGSIDSRLLEYLEVRRHRTQRRAELVINLGGDGRLRTDAITIILDLLESRYQLGEVALFHRTKTCAAAMLERALSELSDALQGELGEEFVERLLDCSDDQMLDYFESRLTAARKGLKTIKRARLQGAIKLVQCLRARELHKAHVVRHEYDLAAVAPGLQAMYAGEDDGDEAKRAAGERRRNALRLLERDFSLPECSLSLYCPPPQMNTKIAEVKILVHDQVKALDEMEADGGDKGLTGGHLRAQKQRFKRLWRVLLAIEPKTREAIVRDGLLSLFGRAVDLLVFNVLPTGVTRELAARELAGDLLRHPKSPLRGRELSQETATAARSDTMLSYPTGLLSLRDRTVPA